MEEVRKEREQIMMEFDDLPDVVSYEQLQRIANDRAAVQ